MGGVGAAYDERRQRIIAFFYKGAGKPGETWAYDLRTNTWGNLYPKNQPLSRRFTTLVYDAKADRILLFGGAMSDDQTAPTNELWAYDYRANTWSQLRPAGGPPPAFYLHIVYDSAADRVILWGGKPAGAQNSVWTYDYNHNTWTEKVYSDGPRPDYDGAMVYAPGIDRVFLYVGDQFWSYHPRQQRWEKLPTQGGPGRQYAAALAYDEQNQRLVLFGGASSKGDTWLYDPSSKKWTVMAPE